MKPGSSSGPGPRLEVDALYPQPDRIEKAAGVIAAGGLIAFPTSTLYGIGADALNPHSVSKIFRAKARPAAKPILILLPDRKMLRCVVASIPPVAVALMDAFWPGRITLVMSARAHLPSDLTAGSGKIGVRIPAHPIPQALLKALQTPITGTSANLSGQPGCRRADDLNHRLWAKMDLVLDAGPLAGGIGSSVVDVTGRRPRILRVGSVSAEALKTYDCHPDS